MFLVLAALGRGVGSGEELLGVLPPGGFWTACERTVDTQERCDLQRPVCGGRLGGYERAELSVGVSVFGVRAGGGATEVPWRYQGAPDRCGSPWGGQWLSFVAQDIGIWGRGEGSALPTDMRPQ